MFGSLKSWPHEAAAEAQAAGGSAEYCVCPNVNVTPLDLGYQAGSEVWSGFLWARSISMGAFFNVRGGTLRMKILAALLAARAEGRSMFFYELGAEDGTVALRCCLNSLVIAAKHGCVPVLLFLGGSYGSDGERQFINTLKDRLKKARARAVIIRNLDKADDKRCDGSADTAAACARLMTRQERWQLLFEKLGATGAGILKERDCDRLAAALEDQAEAAIFMLCLASLGELPKAELIEKALQEVKACRGKEDPLMIARALGALVAEASCKCDDGVYAGSGMNESSELAQELAAHANDPDDDGSGDGRGSDQGDDPRGFEAEEAESADDPRADAPEPDLSDEDEKGDGDEDPFDDFFKDDEEQESSGSGDESADQDAAPASGILDQQSGKNRDAEDDDMFDLSFAGAEDDIHALIDRLGRISRNLKAGKSVGLHSGSVLFFGPPGTGKTELAKHIGKIIGRKVKVITGADLLRSAVGDTEQLIKKAFASASRKGEILVIDEVDYLLNDRKKMSQAFESSMVDQFLACMNDFTGILICTTNFYSSLDDAVTRRFTQKFRFDYARPEQLKPMWEKYLGGCATRALNENEERRLTGYRYLTPSDFLNVRNIFDPNLEYAAQEPEVLLNELEKQQQSKKIASGSVKTCARRIGFI